MLPSPHPDHPHEAAIRHPSKAQALQCTALREEAVELVSQLRMLRKRKRCIRLQYEGRILRRFPEKRAVLIDVRDGEIQCARLADTEDIARAPKFQVLLCDLEAII